MNRRAPRRLARGLLGSRKGAVALVVALLASRAVLAADTSPPTIDRVETTVRGGHLIISARIVDESGVFGPTLHYRTGASGHFDGVPMTLRDGRYEASLPLHEHLEYWIEAYDIYGNGPARQGSRAAPERWTRHRAPAPGASAKKEKDKTPPTLRFTPPKGVHSGEEVTFVATAKDPSGIFSPTLYYRAPGATDYRSVEMNQAGDQISASVKVTGDLEYYIDVYDTAGNGPAQAGTAAQPLHLRVAPVPVVARTTPVAKRAAPKLPAAATELATPSLWARIKSTVVPVVRSRRTWWIAGGAVGTAAVVAGVVAIALASRPSSSAASTWLVIQHAHP